MNTDTIDSEAFEKWWALDAPLASSTDSHSMARAAWSAALRSQSAQRDAALEEAAQLCVAIPEQKDWLESDAKGPDFGDGCCECAEQIRALKGKP